MGAGLTSDMTPVSLLVPMRNADGTRFADRAQFCGLSSTVGSEAGVMK